VGPLRGYVKAANGLWVCTPEQMYKWVDALKYADDYEEKHGVS
jgi:hypothetical protein